MKSFPLLLVLVLLLLTPSSLASHCSTTPILILPPSIPTSSCPSSTRTCIHPPSTPPASGEASGECVYENSVQREDVVWVAANPSLASATRVVVHPELLQLYGNDMSVLVEALAVPIPLIDADEDVSRALLPVERGEAVDSVVFEYQTQSFHSYSIGMQEYVAAFMQAADASGWLPGIEVSIKRTEFFPFDFKDAHKGTMVESTRELVESLISIGKDREEEEKEDDENQQDDDPSVRIIATFPIPYREAIASSHPVLVFATIELMHPSLPAAKAQRAPHFPPHVGFLTPSSWSATGLAAWGVPRDQIYVVPHTVDTSVFTPFSEEDRATLRKELNFEGKLVFLSVGSMTDNKNPKLLIEAFVEFVNADLENRLLNAVLILKGSGMYKGIGEEVQTLVDEIKKQGAQIVLTWSDVEVEGMVQMYAAADAYIAPYKYEGFNLPPLEAIACGTPAIVTSGGATDAYMHEDVGIRIPSLVEAGKHPQTGRPYYFHYPANASVIVEAMEQIAATRPRVPQSALDWVDANFGHEAVGAGLAAAINDLTQSATQATVSSPSRDEL